ncbi:VacJ family lipoprotein [Amaricoccus sp.]|uniref:MlaA family lipoprotein n=1 Tax=Amaricoccus sp. TaxID=1872485 RepID=UPI001B4D44AB|nr:VacJ family lipoprotein [Amaricoccus sp.]MBP7001647.1 VacJ family lipoprotein [Amaricoccus sp.]
MRRTQASDIPRALAVLCLCASAGCATRPAPPPSLEDDPLEEQNRSSHQLNVALDSTLYGPAARTYGAVVPEPARNGVTNLVNHSRLPHGAIQYLLQGRPEMALQDTLRFAVNTVFGLGGLLDPAREMGLPYRETNVDETLHVWGVPAGGYWELPVGGPGTQRDWIGYGIDVVVDPAFYLTGGASYVIAGLRGVDLLHDRYKLDPAVEALLYESSDSYTAQRISYLQNMTSRLQGGATALETLEDPYADQ